ncbi:MAG: gliding motility-associated C-terminal domain-containing protein [Spirochaetes bacterium]|nr:gliding motility-associated C-terminal domain-containing protein [Spirochaetota bacterium]
MEKRRKFILFILVIIILSSSVLFADSRSMYLWFVEKDVYMVPDLLDDKVTLIDDLVYFCNHLPGTEDKVDKIYIYIDQSILASKAGQIRSFISEMHVKGINIFALNGAPDWSQTNNGLATNYCKAVLGYNQDYSPYERFDGIDLDIEMGAGFSSSQFPFVLRKCKTVIDAYNSKYNDDMILSAFIDRQLTWATRTNAINSVDWIVHEDYKDDTTGNPIIQEVTNYLKFASAKGKNMIIAYETQSTNDWPLPPGHTFAEEGWRYMELKISKAKGIFKNYSAFKGIGIHAYHSYRKILPPQRGWITINNGEKYTSNPQVKVLTGCANASEMMISEENTFFNKIWEPYLTLMYYTFGDQVGTKNLYFKFRNITSITLESDIYHDSIAFQAQGDISQVLVYPNVINFNQSGEKQIIFKNLTYQSRIKIFNFFEELVFEKSMENTSEFFWDCKNSEGRVLPSGTYIYIISNDRGQEKKGKLVIIR